MPAPGTPFADLVALAEHLRQELQTKKFVLLYAYNGTGKTHAQGDFNFDSKVDFSDLVTLAQNYNGVIAPPPPMAPLPLAAPVASLPSTQSIERKAIFSTVPLARPKPASIIRSRNPHRHWIYAQMETH